MVPPPKKEVDYNFSRKGHSIKGAGHLLIPFWTRFYEIPQIINKKKQKREAHCCHLHYKNHTLIRCHPFFVVVIFSSRRNNNLCRNKSIFTFWKKEFNKVSDKLLEQLLVLSAAKLKTACTKLVYVPRSLGSNLEQNENIFLKGISYHMESFVGAAWSKY